MFIVCTLLLANRAWSQDAPPAGVSKLVETLKAAGGEAWVRRADPPRNWESGVDFHAKTSDDALQAVGETKGFIAMRILKGGVSDKGLAHLQKLPDLEVLIVYSADVSDEGLKSVGKLASLTKLDIAGPRLTNKGLTELN